MVSQRANPIEIQSKLVPWLQGKMPRVRKLHMLNMRTAERGYSTETYLFDLSWEEDGQHRSEGMVLRRPPELPLFPDYDLRRQFLVMKRLQGSTVPVPRVYWLERDESVIGDSFYVMGEVKGVTPSDYPVYHSSGAYFDATQPQRAKMWWGCVESVAEIHKLDWNSLGLSFLGAPPAGTSPLDGVLAYYESCLHWATQGPQPILEKALEWLKANRYTPEHVTLCWGDSRMSNIIYGPDFDVVAVLDWEIAYLGDHEADLGWMFFLDWANSEGSNTPRLEGTPGREETVRRYEELTGWKVRNLFYNEVLAGLVLAVPMLRIFRNLAEAGIDLGADVERNNFCTQRLAALLQLPPP